LKEYWTKSKLTDEITAVFSEFKEKPEAVAGNYYTDHFLEAAVAKSTVKISLNHFNTDIIFHLNQYSKSEIEQIIARAVNFRLIQVKPSCCVKILASRIDGIIILQ